MEIFTVLAGAATLRRTGKGVSLVWNHLKLTGVLCHGGRSPLSGPLSRHHVSGFGVAPDIMRVFNWTEK